jgi:hypothetical protein
MAEQVYVAQERTNWLPVLPKRDGRRAHQAQAAIAPAVRQRSHALLDDMQAGEVVVCRLHAEGQLGNRDRAGHDEWSKDPTVLDWLESL